LEFHELNLSNPLLNALQDAGFENATPIQQKAFPAIMSGKDVVGIAQTGTGKTLAYLLPLLRQLKYSEQRYPRILIMVPTRELVLQVMEEAKKLTSYMSVRIKGVYGGTNINTQSQNVYEGTDVLVATPGRLFDLNMRGTLRLKQIQKLVIDEVDEMLSLGFRHQIINIMELLPSRRQNLMFSATLADEVEEIIKEFFFDPVWIDVEFRGTPLTRIDQKAFIVPNFATQFNLLSLLLEEEDVYTKTLIFAPDKKTADKIFNKLSIKYPQQLGVIHSNKSQNQRFNTLADFQNGFIRVLISTDLVARGVDIFEVSHVINFGLPEISGSYLHRIGRTGRAEREGIAISLVREKEKKLLTSIENYIKKSIPVAELPADLLISEAEEEDEKPTMLGDKDYLQNQKLPQGGSAFHQKKEKNLKVNKRRISPKKNTRRKKRK